MKKFLLGFILFVIVLLTMIVVGVNSSYTVKKVVDQYAPDYNISYQDIRGNIFTGIQIDGLKFSDMNISSEVRFSWSPSQILYRHIAIDEVSMDDIDIDTLKAFIASLPSSHESSDETSSFPLVIDIDKVHISILPFKEKGIYVKKSLLDAQKVTYSSKGIDIGALDLFVESNITNMQLTASMDKGVLKVDTFEVHDIDTEAITSLLASFEENRTEVTSPKQPKSQTPLNPLLPKVVEVAKLDTSLKPFTYQGVSVTSAYLRADRLYADIEKIVAHQAFAVHMKQGKMALESSVGALQVLGALEKDTFVLEKVDARGIDTAALQAMFGTDNENNTTYAQTVQSKESNATTDRLLPQKVLLKQLHIDTLPTVYEPVHIHTLSLDAANLLVDLPQGLVKEGRVDLNATTNLTNIEEHGLVRDNQLVGHLLLHPNEPLFEQYHLPLRKEAIGDIGIDFNASKEGVAFDMQAKARHLLRVKEENNTSKPFNIDIDHLYLYGTYRFAQKKTDAHLDMNVTSPYAKASRLHTDLLIDGSTIQYEGMLKAGELEGLETNMLSPLRNLHLAFKGDQTQLETTIDSQGLRGRLNIPDLKKGGVFHIETKTPIALGTMVALPQELNATKVNAMIDAPIRLAEPLEVNATAKIRSNLVDIDATMHYAKEMSLSANAVIPENSLLKQMNDHVQWQAVSPLKVEMKRNDTEMTFNAHSSKLSAQLHHSLDDGTVAGNILLAGMTTTLEGTIPGPLVVHSDVKSFRTLMRTLSSFYAVEELPKLDGQLSLSLILTEEKEVYLNLLSPQIIYHADRKTTHTIDDVSIMVKKSGDNIALSAYHLIYNDMTFYSGKPSVVYLKEDTVTIEQFWLNNQLKISGGLNLKSMQGKIDAKAPSFHFVHEWFDVDAKVDIETVFDGNSTDVNGKVTLLKGNIYYDLATKTFPNDSDIVIVQEMKKGEKSTFMDHLKMLVKVDTQSPIVYKQGPVNMKATLDVGVHKAPYSDTLIIGSIDIVDGSSYTFEGKRFTFEHSHIYLTGDPAKPLLDLTVKYKALKHVVTIVITGTPTMPNILFSSVPSLSREQILSLILFDSEEAAGTGDADDMMKMMGGAMAKTALNDLGVKIDHLVFGEGNSVEVGKKLTDKTTVIYINGEVPRMEVKYEYSPTIEVIVGASEQSESVDVVYKNDFNMKHDDDIVIKGR